MNIHSHIEFPSLNYNKHLSYDSFLQEQFVLFQFNLTRKNSYEHVLILYNDLILILKFIKKYIHHYHNDNDNDNNNDNNNDNTHKQALLLHLNFFFKLIPYTRDISHGKGERILSYMLILAFYDVFPSLATFALHYIVKPTDSLSPCGSWKDIKRFCEFVKHFSHKADKHSLIELCVEMTVNQFIQDLNNWVYYYDTSFISNLAAWIPRENKVGGWLFHRIAISWAHKIHPHFLKYTTSNLSLQKAHSKCKRLFRQKISYMNRILDTAEIKFSQNKIHNINTQNIKLGTATKHFDLFINNSKIINHNTLPFPKNNIYTNSSHDFAFIIKQALLIINNKQYYSIEQYQHKIGILNSIWDKLTNKFYSKSFLFTIPIIDVSLLMQQNNIDAFYYAIGVAITIAIHSVIPARIIAMGIKPVWIQFNKNDSIIDIIQHFFFSISPIQNNCIDYYNTINFIIKGIHNSFSTSRFTDQLNIVFIGDFTNNIHHIDIQHIFYQNNLLTSPYIFYWNFSTNNIISINTPVNNQKIRFSSGYSINMLHDLNQIITLQQNSFFSTYQAATLPLLDKYTSFYNYLFSIQ